MKQKMTLTPNELDYPTKETIELAVATFIQLILDQTPSPWTKKALSNSELESFSVNLTNRCLMNSSGGCKIECDYTPNGLLADALEDTRKGAGTTLGVIPPKTWVHISKYLPGKGKTHGYNVIANGKVISNH